MLRRDFPKISPLLSLFLLLSCCFLLATSSSPNDPTNLKSGSKSQPESSPAAHHSLESLSSSCSPPFNELMDWAVSHQVISWSQKEALLKKHPDLLFDHFKKIKDLPPAPASTKEEEETKTPFTSIIATLSLLHVLYFFGALLVIGSMTLFVTLGWQQFGGVGLFFIAMIYGIAFGIVGVSIWFSSEDYRMLGGLFCAMSISMAPMSTYGLLDSWGWWRRGSRPNFQEYRLYIKSSWIPLDIVTIVVGTFYLSFIRFPFLLAPVSFAAWFLSMDIVPIIVRKHFSWAERLDVSTWFGLGMIFVGYIVEQRLGTVPDFGFWLYLFGLIAFWSGITFGSTPISEISSLLYTVINVALLVYGQAFDRTTFLVFGGVGVIIGFIAPLGKLLKEAKIFTQPISTSLLGHIFRVLLVVILLGLALQTDFSIFVTIPAFFAVLSVNLSFFSELLGKSELVYLFHFTANLGFLFLTKEFHHQWQNHALQALALAGLAFFQAGIVITKSSTHGSAGKFAFWIYRLAASIAMCFFPGLLQVESSIVLVGLLGIFLTATLLPVEIIHSFLPESDRKRVPIQVFSQFCLIVGYSLAMVWGDYFHVMISWYVGYALILIILQRTYEKISRLGATLLSLVCLLLSVSFDSSFLAALAGIFIYAYLTELAYRVFKESLLFPFFLTIMGLFILYIGYLYQANLGYLQGFFFKGPSALALFISSYEMTIFSTQSFELITLVRETTFQQLLSLESLNTIRLPLWAASFAFSVKKASQFFALLTASASVLVLFLVNFLQVAGFFKKTAEQPLCRNVTLDDVKLAEGTENHGIVLKISGSKDPSLQVTSISLNLEGEEIWKAARSIPPVVVSAARSIFLPFRLGSKNVDLGELQSRRNQFTLNVSLGTTNPRVLHSTILQTLRSFPPNAAIDCAFYSNGWFSSKKLFTVSITAGELKAKLDHQHASTQRRVNRN